MLLRNIFSLQMLLLTKFGLTVARPKWDRSEGGRSNHYGCYGETLNATCSAGNWIIVDEVFLGAKLIEENCASGNPECCTQYDSKDCVTDFGQTKNTPTTTTNTPTTMTSATTTTTPTATTHNHTAATTMHTMTTTTPMTTTTSPRPLLTDFDINECLSNPCQNGGACTDGVNKYTCTCSGGWTGTRCQSDVDECSSNPCQNGATCTHLQNRYMCTCAEGWTGTSCQTATDTTSKTTSATTKAPSDSSSSNNTVVIAIVCCLVVIVIIVYAWTIVYRKRCKKDRDVENSADDSPSGPVRSTIIVVCISWVGSFLACFLACISCGLINVCSGGAGSCFGGGGGGRGTGCCCGIGGSCGGSGCFNCGGGYGICGGFECCECGGGTGCFGGGGSGCCGGGCEEGICCSCGGGGGDVEGQSDGCSGGSSLLDILGCCNLLKKIQIRKQQNADVNPPLRDLPPDLPHHLNYQRSKLVHTSIIPNLTPDSSDSDDNRLPDNPNAKRSNKNKANQFNDETEKQPHPNPKPNDSSDSDDNGLPDITNEIKENRNDTDMHPKPTPIISPGSINRRKRKRKHRSRSQDNRNIKIINNILYKKCIINPSGKRKEKQEDHDQSTTSDSTNSNHSGTIPKQPTINWSAIGGNRAAVSSKKKRRKDKSRISGDGGAVSGKMQSADDNQYARDAAATTPKKKRRSNSNVGEVRGKMKSADDNQNVSDAAATPIMTKSKQNKRRTNAENNDKFTKLNLNGNVGQSTSQDVQSARNIHSVEMKPLKKARGKYIPSPHLKRVGHSDDEEAIDGVKGQNSMAISNVERWDCTSGNVDVPESEHSDNGIDIEITETRRKSRKDKTHRKSKKK